MATYKITGGIPLKGEIVPVSNKNSILKLIPAALLTDETVVIHNVPKSSDVRLMLKIIKDLGAKVSYFNGGNSIRINSSTVNTYEIDYVSAQKIMSSVMFMGPLLLKFGKAFMPVPGGCKLGTRPLDVFMENMVEMGAKWTKDQGYYLEVKKFKAKDIWSWFPSVTGTENLIMIAVKTPGKTTIYNAACEPHTQDLCNMLVSMGAKITGIGSNRLEIEGVETLKGTEWSVIPDHLDIGGYIAAAVLTNGCITIRNAIPNHMQLMLQVFNKFGVKVEINENDITVPANQKLACQKTVKGDIFEIYTMPWPGLPIDFNQIVLVTALKSSGSIILHNSFQEYGNFWIEELIKLRAKLIMADPHRIITYGPTEFKGAKLKAPNIIQATYALFLAALSAKGETILEDVDNSLQRRFPDIVEKFSSLGAKIEVL